MWSGILGILIKIIQIILEIRQADEKAKKEFISFVAAMESYSLASVNLNESDRSQVDELKRRRDELAKRKK